MVQFQFVSQLMFSVLGGISDFVLEEYSDIDPEHRLWAENYPFGFRDSGAQLDALLHKAYRCLHDINISAQNNHLLQSKDIAVPQIVQTSNSTLIKQNSVNPESTRAGARLYRCIMRTYVGGRRTIPKDALECVLSAMPSTSENESFQEIKKFLFKPSSTKLIPLEEDISNCHLYRPVDMDEIKGKIPDCLREPQTIDDSQNISDDALRVRKGICKYLTDGPLPSLGDSAFSPKAEESKTVKEREIATEAEISVYKKFMYFIESLQYEADDASKWYRAGLCLEVKIHIIMDRLKQLHPAYNANDFFLKKFRSAQHREMHFRKMDHESLAFSELIENQYSEYQKNFCSSEYLLGEDLLIYLENQWSCFSSLKEMSLLVGKRLRHQENSADFVEWRRIQSKFDEGDVSEWQSIWGKKFLIALQSMREKCFHAALYLSKEKGSSQKQSLHAEIAESLGTMYYSDMGFSQSKVTMFEVREQSKLAQSYFESALSSILKSENEDDLADYELQLMIGKVS